MFNKNSRLTFEILPDGKVLVESFISKRNSPEEFAALVNNVLTRGYFSAILDSISRRQDDVSSEVCERVSSLQEKIELRPKVLRARNPLIRPRDVFRAYQEDR